MPKALISTHCIKESGLTADTDVCKILICTTAAPVGSYKAKPSKTRWLWERQIEKCATNHTLRSICCTFPDGRALQKIFASKWSKISPHNSKIGKSTMKCTKNMAHRTFLYAPGRQRNSPSIASRIGVTRIAHELGSELGSGLAGLLPK